MNDNNMKNNNDKNNMKSIKMNENKQQQIFLSKIASNIGPSLPISLLHQLKENHVQHCNLHANDLKTLDVYLGDNALTGVVDDVGVYDDCDDGTIYYHGKDSLEKQIDTINCSMLNGLIELDVSSNHLGYRYKKKMEHKGSKGNHALSTHGPDKNEYNDKYKEEGGEGEANIHNCHRKKKISILSLCPNLHVLNISSNDLSTDTLSSLFRIPSLSLSISSPPSSPSSPPPPPPLYPPPPATCKGMIQLINLMDLNLSHNGLSSIPNELRRVCPNLRKLNVEDNFLSSTKHFLRSLYPLRNSLKILIVKGEKEDDDNDDDQIDRDTANNSHDSDAAADSTSPAMNLLCLEDTWRQRTVCILTNLVTLDGIDVTVKERDEARFALEIGWIDRNKKDCDSDNINSKQSKGGKYKEGHSACAAMKRTLEKGEERTEKEKKKSAVHGQNKSDISGIKQGKAGSTIKATGIQKVTPPNTRKCVRIVSNEKKKQQYLQNQFCEKGKVSSFRGKQLGEKTTDVVAKKFDKALSGIQQRRRKHERFGHNYPPSFSKPVQNGERFGDARYNTTTSEIRQWTEDHEDVFDEHGMSLQESPPTKEATPLGISQKKLNRIEDRVKLLSELAGEQAEVAERLLLLSDSATSSQKHLYHCKQVPIVSNVSVQTNLTISKDDGDSDIHIIKKPAVENAVAQILPETKTMKQKNRETCETKEQQSHTRAKVIVWIMVAISKQQQCTFLRISFQQWKFHTAAKRYADELKNEVSTFKSRILHVENESEQRTEAKISKIYQDRIEEFQDELEKSRGINVTLERKIETIHTKLHHREKYQLKMKREYEQDMMLLGEASRRKTQELIAAVRRDEENRFRLERDNTRKEMERLEKGFSEQIYLLRREKNIVFNEAKAAKEALDGEREKRKTMEIHYKELEKKQEIELQIVKEEALKMHEKEQKQSEKNVRKQNDHSILVGCGKMPTTPCLPPFHFILFFFHECSNTWLCLLGRKWQNTTRAWMLSRSTAARKDGTIQASI